MFFTRKSFFLNFFFIFFTFIQSVPQSYALLDDPCQMLNDFFTFNKLYVYDSIKDHNIINFTDSSHFTITKYTRVDYDWSDENDVFKYNGEARNFIRWYSDYTDIKSVFPDLNNKKFINNILRSLKVDNYQVYVPDISEEHFSLDKSWSKTLKDCPGKAQYTGYYHKFSGYFYVTKFVAGIRHEVVCRYIQLFLHPITQNNKLDIQQRCL